LSEPESVGGGLVRMAELGVAVLVSGAGVQKSEHRNRPSPNLLLPDFGRPA
jgi:hypothetical protein